jgi:hypothetical protein
MQNRDSSTDVWNTNAPLEALKQVADLVSRAAALESSAALDGRSFHLNNPSKDPRPGILSASIELVDNSVILGRLELLRTSSRTRVDAAAIFGHLSSLGDRCRLLAPTTDSQTGENSLWVELKIQATPMSIARANAFLSELRNVRDLAVAIQAEVPLTTTDDGILAAYKSVADYLEPLMPWNAPSELPLDWARETVDFLGGASSIALAAPHAILGDFALAALAYAGKEFGRTFGRILAPTINGRALVEAANTAPGTVVVPAVRLSLGTNPYELGNEMQALLAALTSAGTPALFTGTIEQLQSVFHGGQGAAANPLLPIVRYAPDAEIATLARFAVRSASRRFGGLAQRDEEDLTGEAMQGIEAHMPSEQRRILPGIASRVVNIWAAASKSTAAPVVNYAEALSGLSETLSGLSVKPRASRPAKVEESFTRLLTDPGLVDFFKDRLLGQDHALDELVARLRTEALTRPAHQPLRYCAQGTPATGKSESAVLLARRLEVPYVNIDAASIPDYYTAAAQLLGSGRGIVGSYQSGRLEQAAKHHAGAVVEVSDLDHARPSVRSALADLFLQVLETGEAQAANGALFSCANLIFAFTMNLPDGMDETVRKGIGFNSEVTREALTARVSLEIKRMLSSAFLSRVGAPILFDPITGPALAAIIERAIKSAIESAAIRLGLGVRDVIIAGGLGHAVISQRGPGSTSFGARALLERGRALAAQALADLDLAELTPDEPLTVSAESAGTLRITGVKKQEKNDE